MLYQLCHTANYDIPAQVATPLYTAILTDTGSFRFSNVTPRALSTAASLVERGADAAAIADRIYGFHPLRKYKLLGKALATLQTCCSGRAAFMWVTQRMLKDVGGSLLDASEFENLPRTVKGTEIAILFKQKKDCRTVQVSLRSKRRLHDVSRLAESFGGGGHPAAAGCILTGSMASVQEQVLRAVERELAQTNPPVPPSSCQKTNVEDHNDSIP
jgi:phosphoesterase RecJ-like protein